MVKEVMDWKLLTLEEERSQLFFGEKEKTEKLLEYKYVYMLQIVSSMKHQSNLTLS